MLGGRDGIDDCKAPPQGRLDAAGHGGMRLAFCGPTHRRAMRRSQLMSWANRRPKCRDRRRQRQGSLTVEMILVVVVLAIVTVGVVQFGVFFANAQEVALAARVGALEASQTAGLSTTNGNPVPANVISAIEHQLESSCIEWTHIRLEHNVTGGLTPVHLESDQGGGFICEPKTDLLAPPAAGTRYVRLTVCVPLNEVFPKSLSFFGEQLFPSTRTYEHTAVFRYELGTP